MVARPAVQALVVARLLQGAAVGASVPAGTAALADLLGPSRAARVAAAATTFGPGAGPPLTGLALLWRPAASPPGYWAALGLPLGCRALAPRLRDGPGGSPTAPGLPRLPRGALPYAGAIAAPWAGPALSLAIAPGALARPLARRLGPRRGAQAGLALPPPAYGLLVAGAWRGQAAFVLAGAALAGVACFGLVYAAGMAAVARAAGGAQARAVAGYLACAYAGFGLPAVPLGFLADRAGLLHALLGFGLAVAAAPCLFAASSRGASAGVQDP